MYYLKIVIVIVFVGGFSNAQDTTLNTVDEKYLKNFIRLGAGSTKQFFNFGGGIFFPVSNSFLIGVRANGNIELELFKRPEENLVDLSAALKYVPIVGKAGFASVNAGIGYSWGQKRGKFISRKVFVAEEYEKIKYNSVSGLFELEGGFFLSKSVGISLTGFSILNNQTTVLGYQISLFLYRLD